MIFKTTANNIPLVYSILNKATLGNQINTGSRKGKGIGKPIALPAMTTINTSTLNNPMGPLDSPGQ